MSSSLSSAAARQPSDLELLNDYLRPLVFKGAAKPGGAARVHAADLYAAEPAALAKGFGPTATQDGERAWYFLSPLRTKSPRGVGTRKSRAVPPGPGGGEGGCWHSESKHKDVFDGCGRHVGYRQFFSFRRKDESGKPFRTGWIMYEFHLHEDEEDSLLERTVLCKMYRSPRHRDPEDEAECVVLSKMYRSPRRRAPTPDAVEDARSSTTLSAEPASPGSESESVGGDENSNTANDVCLLTMATVPAEKRAATAVDDKEDSSASRSWRKKHLTVSIPPRKKMKIPAEGRDSSEMPSPCEKVSAEDDKSSGPVSAREGKEKAAMAPTAVELHCPQCGFHLGALKAAVGTPAKSETGMGIAQVVAAASPQEDAEKDHPALHQFFI